MRAALVVVNLSTHKQSWARGVCGEISGEGQAICDGGSLGGDVEETVLNRIGDSVSIEGPSIEDAMG